MLVLESNPSLGYYPYIILAEHRSFCGSIHNTHAILHTFRSQYPSFPQNAALLRSAPFLLSDPHRFYNRLIIDRCFDVARTTADETNLNNMVIPQVTQARARPEVSKLLTTVL